MNKKMITGIALCGLVAGFASADTMRLDSVTSDVNWTDSIWHNEATRAKNQAPPLIGEDAQIKRSTGGSTVTINSANAVCSTLKMGVFDNARTSLIIENGGMLTSSEDGCLGRDPGAGAAMLVKNGGKADFKYSLIIAGHKENQVSSLVVEQGGSVASRDLKMGFIDDLGNSYATSTIGGVLTIRRNLSIAAGSVLNIVGTGTVIVDGDATGLVNGYIANGLIKGDGVAGASAVQVRFDGKTGRTTIVAIQKPATLGLLIAFGGTLVFVGRRFMS